MAAASGTSGVRVTDDPLQWLADRLVEGITRPIQAAEAVRDTDTTTAALDVERCDLHVRVPHDPHGARVDASIWEVLVLALTCVADADLTSPPVQTLYVDVCRRLLLSLSASVAKSAVASAATATSAAATPGVSAASASATKQQQQQQQQPAVPPGLAINRLDARTGLTPLMTLWRALARQSVSYSSSPASSSSAAAAAVRNQVTALTRVVRLLWLHPCVDLDVHNGARGQTALWFAVQAPFAVSHLAALRLDDDTPAYRRATMQPGERWPALRATYNRVATFVDADAATHADAVDPAAWRLRDRTGGAVPCTTPLIAGVVTGGALLEWMLALHWTSCDGSATADATGRAVVPCTDGEDWYSVDGMTSAAALAGRSVSSRDVRALVRAADEAGAAGPDRDAVHFHARTLADTTWVDAAGHAAADYALDVLLLDTSAQQLPHPQLLAETVTNPFALAATLSVVRHVATAPAELVARRLERWAQALDVLRWAVRVPDVLAATANAYTNMALAAAGSAGGAAATLSGDGGGSAGGMMASTPCWPVLNDIYEYVFGPAFPRLPPPPAPSPSSAATPASTGPGTGTGRSGADDADAEERAQLRRNAELVCATLERAALCTTRHERLQALWRVARWLRDAHTASAVPPLPGMTAAPVGPLAAGRWCRGALDCRHDAGTGKALLWAWVRVAAACDSLPLPTVVGTAPLHGMQPHERDALRFVWGALMRAGAHVWLNTPAGVAAALPAAMQRHAAAAAAAMAAAVPTVYPAAVTDDEGGAAASPPSRSSRHAHNAGGQWTCDAGAYLLHELCRRQHYAAVECVVTDPLSRDAVDTHVRGVETAVPNTTTTTTITTTTTATSTTTTTPLQSLVLHMSATPPPRTAVAAFTALLNRTSHGLRDPLLLAPTPTYALASGHRAAVRSWLGDAHPDADADDDDASRLTLLGVVLDRFVTAPSGAAADEYKAVLRALVARDVVPPMWRLYVDTRDAAGLLAAVHAAAAQPPLPVLPPTASEAAARLEADRCAHWPLLDLEAIPLPARWAAPWTTTTPTTPWTTPTTTTTTTTTTEWTSRVAAAVADDDHRTQHAPQHHGHLWGRVAAQVEQVRAVQALYTHALLWQPAAAAAADADTAVDAAADAAGAADDSDPAAAAAAGPRIGVHILHVLICRLAFGPAAADIVSGAAAMSQGDSRAVHRFVGFGSAFQPQQSQPPSQLPPQRKPQPQSQSQPQWQPDGAASSSASTSASAAAAAAASTTKARRRPLGAVGASSHLVRAAAAAEGDNTGAAAAAASAAVVFAGAFELAGEFVPFAPAATTPPAAAPFAAMAAAEQQQQQAIATAAASWPPAASGAAGAVGGGGGLDEAFGALTLATPAAAPAFDGAAANPFAATAAPSSGSKSRRPLARRR